MVTIKKSRGGYRICIDFRKLNQVAKKDAYPNPYMETVLNKLEKARFISVIDLKSAYHQIALTDKSKEYTAFTVPGKGLWQYKRFPFGLSGAKACFQRLVNKVIGDLKPHEDAYLDDIVLVSETFEEHLEILRKLLLKINAAGLTINREKSEFCVNEVKYLGFIVNEKGLSINLEKIKSIRQYIQYQRGSDSYNAFSAWHHGTENS